MQTIIILFLLLFGHLYAETNTTKCVLVSHEDYMRVGDVDSKEIFTKTDYLYDCNTTIVKKGPCVKWGTRHEDYNASYRPEVTFKSDDFNGSANGLFNLVSAYNGVQYIWGGWKGICTIGTVTDFSWAEDPLYWASLAIQAAGGTGAIPDSKAVEYGMCVAQAAVGAGKALSEYYDDSEVPCDPIDEFCGENDADSPDNIVSMDEQAWNDALAHNPDLADYTEVVSRSGGVVTVRFSPHDTTDMSAVDKDAEDKKAKEMKLKFKAISVGVNAGICLGSVGLGYGAAPTSSVGNGGSLTSAANITTTVVGAINPLAGAVLSLAINIATSFDTIDTCHNKDDAKERGSRHEKTFTHKAYEMCHRIRIEKDISSSIFTSYDNYHYCCYPDVVARILTEQIKAQLARSWAHCTDITFKDLEKVEFRACTPAEIADPASVDGTKIQWGASSAERKNAFQQKHRCIDYTDLNTYIKNKLGGVDNFNFEEQVKGLKRDSFSLDVNGS